MEFMDWFILFCCVISFVSIYISFSSLFYSPEKVLIEVGEEVLISHLPLARLIKEFRKVVPKSFVSKIQLAGNCVTLFNSSGNAIDIWFPKEKLAKPIFFRAKEIFKDADAVVINC